MDATATFYSRPSYVGGGGVIFSGARRQRGGSIFGALKSVVMPVLKRVGRSFGRIATKNALGLATDVISDTLSGRNVKDSLKNRGREHLLSTANEGLSSISNQFFGARSNHPRTRGVKKRRTQRGSGKKKSSGKRSSARSRSSSRKPQASRKRRATRSISATTRKRRPNY